MLSCCIYKERVSHKATKVTKYTKNVLNNIYCKCFWVIETLFIANEKANIKEKILMPCCPSKLSSVIKGNNKTAIVIIEKILFAVTSFSNKNMPIVKKITPKNPLPAP